MSTRAGRLVGSLASLGLVVACVAAAVWVFANRVWVNDQMTIWRYPPSQQIVALADRASLSEVGRFYLYATRPEVDATQRFNQLCGRKEASSAILGCYDGDRIYIYGGATDPRLDGIKVVTAAHEMLHAAYARLDNAERQRIDALLVGHYDGLNDRGLAERMAYYQRTEPGQHANELHSILGTEYRDLPPELEQYYQRYFQDRQAVVRLHAGYSGVFKHLRQEAHNLTARLNELAGTINRRTQIYNADTRVLSSDIDAFNHGESTMTRQSLLVRVQANERERQAITELVGQYNQLRSSYNAVVQDSTALEQNLDSTLAPMPGGV